MQRVMSILELEACTCPHKVPAGAVSYESSYALPAPRGGWRRPVSCISCTVERGRSKPVPPHEQPDWEGASRPGQNQSVCGWAWRRLGRATHGWSHSLGLWSSIFSLNLLDAWNLSHTSEEFFHMWTRDKMHDIGG